MVTTRRQWLQNAALALPAFSLSTSLLGLENDIPRPGKMILLNSNENAYGPSQKTLRAMAEAASGSNRYPDDTVRNFKTKLGRFWKVEQENIVMGAGSSEILGLVCLMMAIEKKGEIITAEPSFNSWSRQAQIYGMEIVRVPLDEQYQLDLKKMAAGISGKTRLVYICNPNNPTGSWLEHQKLRDFVLETSKTCMVLADEAYTEFAGLPSLATDAMTNRNIIVAKTFSKVYGLAGARVGYAISHPDTIKRIAGLQAWSDVSVSAVSVAAASAALDDQEFVQACIRKTAASREHCYQCFRDIGLTWIPSSTSFILFDIAKIRGDFSSRMQEQNFYVQYRTHFGGKWCRVSIGTTEEMVQFCKTLKGMI